MPQRCSRKVHTMTNVDIPFIVGVIREKEKSLLEDDEYIRIIESASHVQDREALADTAYGIHIANKKTSLQSLDARLTEEFNWLKAMLGVTSDPLTFIAARYDALHSATALIDYKEGKPNASMQVPIGLLTAELLNSTIWHNQGWEDVPVVWREFLQQQRAHTENTQWSRQAVTEAVAQHLVRVMEEVGNSPLMRAVTKLTQERLATEQTIRPEALPGDLPAYEKEWDEKLLSALRNHRLEPHAVDTVIAWWYALATEVKTVRLILTAAGGGVGPDSLTALQRSLYLPWV